MRVDADDFIFVFDVVEDGALAVGDGELGLAGQRDGGDDRVRFGRNDGDVVGAAIERPDGLSDRLEQDVVRTGSDGDGGGDGKGGAVECNYCIGATVSDVAEAAGGGETCNQCDGVDAVKIGDRADGFTGVGVDDVDLVAVGDVEAMRAWVSCMDRSISCFKDSLCSILVSALSALAFSSTSDLICAISPGSKHITESITTVPFSPRLVTKQPLIFTIKKTAPISNS